MKLSRWIFIISNILIMLVLSTQYTNTSNTFSDITSNTSNHKTLFIDSAFNEEKIKIITQAADEWNNKTNHIVDFNIQILPSKKKFIRSTDIIIIPVTPNFPDIVLSDKIWKEHNTLGYYNDDGPINFIELVDERLNDNNYKSVVLHELGHSLGLEHNEDEEGTLMYPAVIGGADHITEEDLKNFCVLYQCNYKKLKN